MPALAAEAGREATRLPAGPARAIDRCWTDGGALEAKTAQARMAAIAGNGWARTKNSTVNDVTRPRVTMTRARAASLSARRPPRKEPTTFAAPYASKTVLAIGPDN